MREGNFNRVERVEKGLGVSSQELESGEVIAHAKSAKFAKSDVGNVLTQRHKGTESWPMVRLGDVCEFRRGLTYAKADEVAYSSKVVLRSNNVDLESGELNLNDLKYLREDFEVPVEKIIEPNTLLMCMANGSKSHLGKVALIEQDFKYAFGGFMGLLVPRNINSKYLYYFLSAPLFKAYVKSLQDGANINNLKFSDFSEFQIPLPPIEVQKEIVERLEKELGEADKVAAEFNRMVELADKEFKAELDETFGVLGNGNDSNRVERAERVEKGLGASSQELGLATTTFAKATVVKKNTKSAKPWPMVRLGEIVAINGGFAFKSANYTSNGVRVIRISDFNESGFVNNKIVRHPYDDALKPYILELKDILLCMTGGTVGKCLFVTQMEEVMVVNQRVATIKVKNDMPKYVYWVLSSSITQRVVQYSKNSLNDNISLDTIKGFLIPLPPIEVQKEIVAKLDAAKERCEKLKAEAERGLRAAENLRKAILSEAFEL